MYMRDYHKSQKARMERTESRTHLDMKMVLHNIICRVWNEGTVVGADDKWPNHRAFAVVEYPFPLCRRSKGRAFTWGAEEQRFDETESITENTLFYPTKEAACARDMRPAYIFDVACESRFGLTAVFELALQSGSAAAKRRFCAENHIALYEIDGEKMHELLQRESAVFVDDDGYYKTVRMNYLPLLDGGWFSLEQFATDIARSSGGVFRWLFPERPADFSLVAARSWDPKREQRTLRGVSSR